MPNILKPIATIINLRQLFLIRIRLQKISRHKHVEVDVIQS